MASPSVTKPLSHNALSLACPLVGSSLRKAGWGHGIPGPRSSGREYRASSQATQPITGAFIVLGIGMPSSLQIVGATCNWETTV